MPSDPSVLFICLHGSAKSVIAAQHLRRLAAERGRVVETASAGVEPDLDVPPHVVAGLLADGFDIAGQRPHPVTDAALQRASLVVSLGCDLDEPNAGGTAARRISRRILRWDDVPAVSDGYDAAREAIVRRLVSLVEELLSDAGRVG
jgi:arsenate reductase (thioredoxin)